MADPKNMTLDGYRFPWNPEKCTVPRPEKAVAVVTTYTSAAVFSWGMILPGKEIELTWEWMELDQWNALDTIYQDDSSVVWYPDDGFAYIVEILSLVGEYVVGAEIEAPRRENIVLRLVIISRAAGTVSITAAPTTTTAP